MDTVACEPYAILGRSPLVDPHTRIHATAHPGHALRIHPRLSYANWSIQFNIFYPDLIDKSKAPTYKIIKEPGNDETVLLHFMAGPPYEDIAFRIVNREWEFSHKRYVLTFSLLFSICW